MDRRESPRPLDDLQELDLDAALSDEERAIVAATPFVGLARTLIGLFVVALLLLATTHIVGRIQRERERVRTLAGQIDEKVERVASATPADVVALGRDWILIQRQVRTLDMPGARRKELARAAVDYAQKLLQRGATHLRAIEYLDITEAARIAEVMGMVIDTVGPGLDTTPYRPLLEQTREVATQAAVRMARTGAPPRDLRDAAGLLFSVAPLADPRLQSEYESTARSLLERARVAEERGSVTASLGVGDESLRVEFAGALYALLQGEGSTVSGVSAEGDNARILQIQGRGPRARLAETVLRNADVRGRLLALAFTTVRAVGDDGVLEVDIETLEGRVPPPGR